MRHSPHQEDPAYLQEDENQDFFSFSGEEEEELEERAPLGRRLLVTGIMLLASLLALILLMGGVRTFNEARANEGYEGRTWVITGLYQDATRDLQGDQNVAIYEGSLPDATAMIDKSFISDLGDPQRVGPGQLVTFRGSQTGQGRADFLPQVDALLVQDTESELRVVRTGPEGSLAPVTADTIAAQKRSAIFRLAGAILIFAAGVAATLFLIRKTRSFED